jgi:glycosyltransferase involved in cell wall biosynthesis
MRISAVVPAYNAAKTVQATLDSLLQQSLPPAEVIVVDDGSKDATRAALEPYRDRVRLVFQDNSGVSAARNRGVAEASGDWIAFCDTDDIWHRDKLRIVSAVLAARRDTDLLFHDFWTMTADRVLEARATHSKQTMFPLFREFDITIPRILTDHRRVEVAGVDLSPFETWYGQAFRWLMLGNFIMPSTLVMRKSVFVAGGGFDPQFRYAEDTEFFLRFSKTVPFLWIDAPLTGYRREAGTLLTGNMLLTMRNATRAVVKHCVDDGDVYSGDPRWVRRAVSRRHTRMAYFCLSELHCDEARSHARAALRHRPLNAMAWAIAAGSMLPPSALRLARGLKSRV